MNKIIKELTGPYKRSADSIRLPTHPILGKTALTGYSGVATLNGPEVSGSTTKRLLQFKDPVYPLWYEYNITSVAALGIALTYQTDLVAPAGNPVNPYNAQIEDIYSISTSNVSAAADVVGVTGVAGNWTGLTGVWPLMIDEKLGGQPFVYVPSGFILSVAAWMSTTYAAGGSATGTMMLEFWTAPGETDTQTIVFSDNLTASPGAVKRAAISAVATWLRPRATSLTLAGAGTVGAGGNIYAGLFITPGMPSATLSTTGLGPTFSASTNGSPQNTLLPVPEAMPQQHLANAALSLDNVLMHSSHVLIENMTKVLNKEGMIDAARLNLIVANPWIASSSAFTGVDPVKRYTRAAEHGVQAYVDPTAEYDHVRSHRMFYNYKDNAVVSSLVVMQIRQSDCYNLITITDADVTTVGTFLLRYAAGWEFITTSTLYDTSVVDLRRTPLSMADSAMNVLAVRCPFRKAEGERQELGPLRSLPTRPKRRPGKAAARPVGRAPTKAKNVKEPHHRPNEARNGKPSDARPQGGRGRPAGYPTH